MVIITNLENSRLDVKLLRNCCYFFLLPGNILVLLTNIVYREMYCSYLSKEQLTYTLIEFNLKNSNTPHNGLF